MEIDPVKTFATQQDSGIIVNQQGTWEGDSKVAWRTLPSSYPQVPFSEWMVHGTGFKSTFKNHSKFWVLACTDVVMSGANSLVGTLATGVGSKDRSWCKLVICGYNMLQLNVTSQPEVWLWYGPNLCFTVFFFVCCFAAIFLRLVQILQGDALKTTLHQSFAVPKGAPGSERLHISEPAG